MPPQSCHDPEAPAASLLRHCNVFAASLGIPDLQLVWISAVNSMSDLFHEDVPEDYIQQVFDVMESASHHRFFHMGLHRVDPVLRRLTLAEAHVVGNDHPVSFRQSWSMRAGR